MKSLHDKLYNHFQWKKAESSDEQSEKSKLLKRVILAHISVIILIAIVILFFTFTR